MSTCDRKIHRWKYSYKSMGKFHACARGYQKYCRPLNVGLVWILPFKFRVDSILDS